jgi:hypothetical protein
MIFFASSTVLNVVPGITLALFFTIISRLFYSLVAKVLEDWLHEIFQFQKYGYTLNQLLKGGGLGASGESASRCVPLPEEELADRPNR